MMIAPHPDDESLAAGVLLQRAVTAGGAVRIIYATDGDDNPWPQRALEKRWRLAAVDRVRWGKRRRQEALSALGKLSIPPTSARFLGLPDQGLTRVLLHDGQTTAWRIAALIKAWAPTHLLFPSEMDSHPDHSALALLTRFALEEISATDKGFALLTYLVHGPHARFAVDATALNQTMVETITKRSAIAEHRTQIKLSRRRFMSYARRPECFGGSVTHFGRHRTCAAFRSAEKLRIVFRFPLNSLGRGQLHLLLVGRIRVGGPFAVSLQLPERDASVQITEVATGHRHGLAAFRGNARGGTILLSALSFAPDRPIWAKISRRRCFLERAGWEQIAAVSRVENTKSKSAKDHLVAA